MTHTTRSFMLALLSFSLIAVSCYRNTVAPHGGQSVPSVTTPTPTTTPSPPPQRQPAQPSVPLPNPTVFPSVEPFYPVPTHPTVFPSVLPPGPVPTRGLPQLDSPVNGYSEWQQHMR